MRDGAMTEADTCREFVTPKPVESGWGAAPYAIGEQRSFTNGRIIVTGGKVLSDISRINALFDRHFALKGKHASIRSTNAALLPATLERVFSEGGPEHA